MPNTPSPDAAQMSVTTQNTPQENRSLNLLDSISSPHIPGPFGQPITKTLATSPMTQRLFNRAIEAKSPDDELSALQSPPPAARRPPLQTSQQSPEQADLLTLDSECSSPVAPRSSLPTLQQPPDQGDRHTVNQKNLLSIPLQSSSQTTQQSLPQAAPTTSPSSWPQIHAGDLQEDSKQLTERRKRLTSPIGSQQRSGQGRSAVITYSGATTLVAYQGPGSPVEIDHQQGQIKISGRSPLAISGHNPSVYCDDRANVYALVYCPDKKNDKLIAKVNKIMSQVPEKQAITVSVDQLNAEQRVGKQESRCFAYHQAKMIAHAYGLFAGDECGNNKSHPKKGDKAVESQWHFGHVIAHWFDGESKPENIVIMSKMCNYHMLAVEKAIAEMLKQYKDQNLTVTITAKVHRKDDYKVFSDKIEYHVKFSNDVQFRHRFLPLLFQKPKEDYAQSIMEQYKQRFTQKLSVTSVADSRPKRTGGDIRVYESSIHSPTLRRLRPQS